MIPTMRKLIVAGSVVMPLLAKAVMIADWLTRLGPVGLARGVRSEYVTGPPITIIVVMLVLLVSRSRSWQVPARWCPVGDHELRR